MLVPKRIDTPELLDEHDAPREDMERSLRDLRRFNRFYGGSGVYRRLLRRMAKHDPLSILDVATGTADLVEKYVDTPLRVGVDFKIDHLLYMRDRSTVRRVVGDALQLPFLNNAFEVVTSSHFFHHLTPEQNEEMLQEAMRVARRGVIINDTRRHYIPWLVVKIIGWLRMTGRITRNDAPASVLRGYTPEEVGEIAFRVSAKRVDIVRAWPFRFGLLLWK
ncbi:MAG TPA: methyltransferase domain-containing protein [Thermoanaerobaculia bacterium]